MLLFGLVIRLSSEDVGGGLFPEIGLLDGLIDPPKPGLFKKLLVGLCPPGLPGGLGLLELGLCEGPADEIFAPESDELGEVAGVDTEAVQPLGPHDVVATGKAVKKNLIKKEK